MQKSKSVTSVAKGTEPLYGLQYFRGIGIMLVLMHHVSGYAAEAMYLEWPPAMRELAIRHLHLFFIVSGFIMMYIHGNDSTGFKSFRLYMIKRHIRIFPMVIAVATAGAIGLLFAREIGLVDEVMSWKQYISSAFIYPMLEKPKPVVIWTLRNELTFYVIFGLFFIHRGLFLAGMATWLATSFIFGERGAVGDWVENGALDELSENIFFETLFWDFNYLFVLGIGIYYAMRWVERYIQLSPRQITIGFIISYLAFCIASFRIDLLSPDNVWTNYVLGALSVLIVYFSVGAKLHKSVHSVLLYLGDASYSIYLVHMVVLGFITPVIFTLIGEYIPTAWTLYFMLATLSTVVGLLAYEFFEIPVLRYLRRFAK